jgi:Na+/melibiose symporter-like transporter
VKLSRRTLAAYSAPSLAMAAFATPLAIYAPPFYATDRGLGLASVGAIFMLARFWDIVTDPAMGVLSDKFPSRWGRRRHWLVLSIPLLMVSTVLVMFPGWFDASYGSELYLLSALFVLYIGTTMLTIPHLAWGAELTDDYHERSRVQGWREFTGLTAMALVLVIPAALEQTGYALSATAKMSAMGWYALAIVPIAILIAVSFAGERASTTAPRPIGLVRAVRLLVQNRFLARIVIADLFIHIPGSIRASMFVFYVGAVIGMPEWAAIIMMSYFVAGPLAVPLWMRVARGTSKHKACALGVLLHVIVTVAYLLPGRGDALLFAALFFLSGIVYAGVPFLIRSMVADVVDYDRLQTGQDRTGLYYATVTTTMKVGGALGIGLGYPILAWIGFNPAGPNDAAQLDGLRYVFAFIPAASELLVVYLLYRYPLDETMQRELKSRLSQPGSPIDLPRAARTLPAREGGSLA